ncbi:MAG: UDP-N-acetylglucosamine 2-epimerase (non-hydrolyzing) [Muribaculaceae bacterium]|nr:UDP-N-acetylglucosamine 2-epimerase (non-hydrolyzing) [Muribaculaceae bacterium]
MEGETKTVLAVFGTRPEAIKMAPLVLELRKHPGKFRTLVCVTGQHRSMLDQVLEVFGITPDFDLDIMRPGQDLYDVTSRVLLGMRDVLDKAKPDCVLVHGDTTTSTAAALAAFYRQIPVGHVEAGLRTHDILSPWPEEMNRRITGRIASIHFAPTATGRSNLIAEGVDPSRILVTGNTVIDALRLVVDKIKGDEALSHELDRRLRQAGYDPARARAGRRMVLITGHRRENFGEGFLAICRAIARLATMHPGVDFVYPMHLNPNVRRPIAEVFGSGTSDYGNLFFIEPQEYLSFVRLMSIASVVLTDSGGIQEEAPGLGKPVIVMRDTTERPEAVDAGTVKLVGTCEERIVEEVSALLLSEQAYTRMANAVNPYGDGHASPAIIEGLYNFIR